MADRRGFTLIEVILALTILLVVMVAFMTMTGKTVHTAATSDRQEAAIQLVSDRIEQVRTDPVYDSLETRYGGTESSFPTLPGFTRTTQVVHYSGSAPQPADFKRITVTVNGPGLSTPVSRTVSVSIP